jgi:hypothetical protein
MKQYLFLFCASLFCVQQAFSNDGVQEDRSVQLVKQLESKEEIRFIVKDYLHSAEGRKLIQKILTSDVLEDEVKYAVVRYLHTDEGKELLQNITAKEELGLYKFLTRNLVKAIVLGGIAYYFLAPGQIRNIILCVAGIAVVREI